jgi:hypothetical protein
VDFKIEWSLQDIKHPQLCPAIIAEPRATDTLDCFNATISDGVGFINTVLAA